MQSLKKPRLIRRSTASLAFLLASLIAVGQVAGQGALLFNSDDRASDFLKVILSLPGPTPAPGPWQAVVDKYANSPDYKGTVGLMHLPPVSMFISLLLRWLFATISPVIIYFALMAAFLISVAIILRERTGDFVWAGVALASYPVIFLVDRGNLYAAVAAVPTVLALFRRRPDWIAALLFAVAVNVRPNAMICLLPLAIIDPRFLIKFTICAAPIGLVSLAGATAFYPEYSLPSFFHGLRVYSTVYVPNVEGVSYGSSLYGALFTLGYPHQTVAAIVGLAPLPVALFLQWRGKVTYVESVFICLACSALATAGFRDYHLLPFIVPLILAEGFIVPVMSVLMLAPKSYWMIDQIPASAIINPSILLAAILAVIVRAVLYPNGERIDPASSQSRTPIAKAFAVPVTLPGYVDRPAKADVYPDDPK